MSEDGRELWVVRLTKVGRTGEVGDDEEFAYETLTRIGWGGHYADALALAGFGD
jgi:hypothetical protein